MREGGEGGKEGEREGREGEGRRRGRGKEEREREGGEGKRKGRRREEGGEEEGEERGGRGGGRGGERRKGRRIEEGGEEEGLAMVNVTVSTRVTSQCGAHRGTNSLLSHLTVSLFPCPLFLSCCLTCVSKLMVMCIKGQSYCVAYTVYVHMYTTTATSRLGRGRAG